MTWSASAPCSERQSTLCRPGSGAEEAAEPGQASPVLCGMTLAEVGELSGHGPEWAQDNVRAFEQIFGARHSHA